MNVYPPHNRSPFEHTTRPVVALEWTRFHTISSSTEFRERGSRPATARPQPIFFSSRRIAPLTFRPGDGLQRAYSLRRLARGAIRPGDGLQGPYGRNWPYGFTSAYSAPMNFGGGSA